MTANEFERLRALGWNELRDTQFKENVTSEARAARVIAIHRSIWLVDDGQGGRRATLSGRLRHRSRMGELPVVGDWVGVVGTRSAGSSQLIEWVAPRTSTLTRAEPGRHARNQVLAANVDVVLLAAALPHSVNFRRLERGVAMVWESGAVPIVVLTKADLCDDVAAAVASVRARLTGVDTFALSTYSGLGIDTLADALRPAHTAVLVGPSGVGKSTLLNALLGSERMATAAIRSDGKGRHTTTHRELFRLPNGALLIDTPGLRELHLWDDESSVDATFDDVADLSLMCRFADCSHQSEPGCAVLDAVARGVLDPARLAHWRKLRAELAYLAGRDDARAQAQVKRQGAIGAKAAKAHYKGAKYR